MAVATRSRSASSHEVVTPPLTGGARVDICLAGGGLASLIAAYLLAREQRSVMLLEDGPLGGSAGCAEVAHLACVLEHPYRELERRLGEAGARLAAQSCDAAIEAIETLVRRERLACEFERLDGYALGGAQADLYREAEAAQRAGVSGAEVLEAPPVEGAHAQPCMRYPGLAQLNPHKFATSLTRAALREGARIHRGVRIRRPDAEGGAAIVTEGGHRIDADIAVTQVAQAPPRLINVLAFRVPRGAIARALYWDAGTPLRCARLRTHAAGEVLLVAGVDTPRLLEEWARAHFPRLADVVQRFTAALAAPSEHFDIARAPAGAVAYASAAHWGTMLARSAIAGMAIRDFVDGAASGDDALALPSACHAVRFEPVARRNLL